MNMNVNMMVFCLFDDDVDGLTPRVSSSSSSSSRR